MNRVLILVEGPTEETFVCNILRPHLTHYDIYLISTIVATKRTKSGQTFKGGVTSYARLRRDVLRLCRDTSVAAITTMLDYYGLPDDFPGKNTLMGRTPYQRVDYLEKAFANNIGHQKFLPFLTLHEFEALLFSQPDVILSVFPDLPQDNRVAFQREVSPSLSPEEINDGADTHPSKRITHHIQAYRKALDGPRIAQRIGLPEIRSQCSHFDEWLVRLEQLGSTHAAP